jgi:hypothetical protein
MVAEQDTELKRGKETVSLYLTIPRYIVMDEGFPFKRDEDLQIVTVRIDYENKTLIIKKKNSDNQK